MCLMKFLMGAVVLVVFSTWPSAAQDDCSRFKGTNLVRDISRELEDVRDELTRIESSMAHHNPTATVFNIIPSTSKECSDTGGYRVQEWVDWMRTGINAMRSMRQDINEDLFTAMSLLHHRMHCYLLESNIWDVDTFQENRNSGYAKIPLPTGYSDEDLITRDIHILQGLYGNIGRAKDIIASCSRKKRYQATLLRRELEKRDREIMLRDPLYDLERDSHVEQDLEPVGEDNLGPPDDAYQYYQPQSKRPLDTLFGPAAVVETDKRDSGWNDPAPASLDRRYSAEELKRAWNALYGQAEEQRKRSPSWSTYL